mmetsp:Transcript_2530/g.5573  ORF Transcript_2530/g.5573 Transcript_2530/m.5573 type:complete len:227 (-) Transcript_2530:151-831(-)
MRPAAVPSGWKCWSGAPGTLVTHPALSSTIAPPGALSPATRAESPVAWDPAACCSYAAAPSSRPDCWTTGRATASTARCSAAHVSVAATPTSAAVCALVSACASVLSVPSGCPASARLSIATVAFACSPAPSIRSGNRMSYRRPPAVLEQISANRKMSFRGASCSSRVIASSRNSRPRPSVAHAAQRSGFTARRRMQKPLCFKESAAAASQGASSLTECSYARVTN